MAVTGTMSEPGRRPLGTRQMQGEGRGGSTQPCSTSIGIPAQEDFGIGLRLGQSGDGSVQRCLLDIPRRHELLGHLLVLPCA